MEITLPTLVYGDYIAEELTKTSRYLNDFCLAKYYQLTLIKLK